MLERRKYIEVYNCICSTILGSSVGVLIEVSPGLVTGLEEITHVGLAPEGGTMVYLGNYIDVRGRV